LYGGGGAARGARARGGHLEGHQKGTTNPELVYVVSSHYDSVAVGPGADDDSSGTAALLETARIMARRPQPATIIFASFTGEEAGLLGSREFVRRAVAGRVRVVGALNNDMIGWANDYRLDNHPLFQPRQRTTSSRPSIINWSRRWRKRPRRR